MLLVRKFLPYREAFGRAAVLLSKILGAAFNSASLAGNLPAECAACRGGFALVDWLYGRLLVSSKRTALRFHLFLQKS